MGKIFQATYQFFLMFFFHYSIRSISIWPTFILIRSSIPLSILLLYPLSLWYTLQHHSYNLDGWRRTFLPFNFLTHETRASRFPSLDLYFFPSYISPQVFCSFCFLFFSSSPIRASIVWVGVDSFATYRDPFFFVLSFFSFFVALLHADPTIAG